MENASHAIMIAGGVLIAMIIVSLLLLSHNRISKVQQQKEESTRIQQITDYNKDIESYNKKVVRGYELISVCNLVENKNNKYYKEQNMKKNGEYPEIKVYVRLKNESGGFLNNSLLYKSGSSEGTYHEMCEPSVLNNSDDTTTQLKKLYFECDKIEYNDDGYVTKIYFTESLKKQV